MSDTYRCPSCLRCSAVIRRMGVVCSRCGYHAEIEQCAIEHPEFAIGRECEQIMRAKAIWEAMRRQQQQPLVTR